MTDLISLLIDGVSAFSDYTEEVHLYVLKHPVTGRTVAECMTREMCEREARWNDLEPPLTIAVIAREPSWGYGIGRPVRWVRPWSVKKIEEFTRMYMNGTPWREMEEYFDAAISGMTKRCRHLGLPKRETFEERWEKHCGKWTVSEDDKLRAFYFEDRAIRHENLTSCFDRTQAAIRARLNNLDKFKDWSEQEDELLNFLFDEGVPIREIAIGLSCAEKVIADRLQATSSKYSLRRDGARRRQAQRAFANFRAELKIEERGE